MASAIAPSKPKFTPSFELFSKSSELVKKNWKMFLVLNIFAILQAVSTLFNKPATSGTYKDNSNAIADVPGLSGFSGAGLASVIGGVLIVVIAFAIASFILQSMATVYQLETAQGRTLTFSALWQKTKPYLLRLLGLSIVIGFVIMLGFILLIVPGLIFLRRYYLAPYFLIDKNLGIQEAMKTSAEQTKPVSGYVWGVIGVTLLLSLVAIFPMVGALASTTLLVLYSVAPAMRYLEIKKAQS